MLELDVRAGGEPGIRELQKMLQAGLQQADTELARRFRAGHPVLELVTARAWAVEQLLLFAWSALWQGRKTPALVAVGGFGRGELHPHSDIDLLILFEGGSLPDEERVVVERFVTVLWDAGFYLGHSVRNLAQCEEEVRADVATATSLMEARLLTGPEELFQAMQRNNRPDRVWPPRDFFNAKYAEQQARHAQYNDTAYNLEPNVKEGPGGLRDIQMIGWVAKRHFGARSLHGLVDHGFLTEAEYHKLVTGQHYLWKVRFALHLLAGRAEDRLLFEYQKRTAAFFGFEDQADSNLAVEKFMQGYYRVVTRLERMNERLLQLFREELLVDEAPPAVDIGDGFCLLHGFLDVRDEALFRRRPEALMELFLILARQPEIAGVRASAIRLIVDHLYLVDDQFRRNPRVLAMFMELISQPQGVYTQLQRMNRYVFLEAFVPVFRNIVGRMQFDLFHVYTVDQHILFVVRNLRRFAYGKYQDQFPWAQDIFHSIARPQVLYLAALFHDIAKGRGGDHSEQGAIDAREFCARLPMEQSDRELVEWLVLNHLLMSLTAQKQDISDPETVVRFARKVGTRKRLDHLYLLTMADISATSPKLWNSWKSGLLRELYVATMHVLESEEESRPDLQQYREECRRQAVLALRDRGVDEQRFEALLDSLPEDVFQRYSVGQLVWAAGMRLDASGAVVVAVRDREEREISEVFVSAPDYTGLFATTTSVMDELGLNVLSARVVTTADSFSFDLFQVMDANAKPLLESDRHKLVSRLQPLLEDRQVKEPVQRKMPRRLRPFVSPAVVTFSTARSGTVTAMEVQCTDRPGLLSQLSAAMVKCGVRIHDAMIATLGDRVEDTFFVSDSEGGLLDETLQERLAAAIHERLEGS